MSVYDQLNEILSNLNQETLSPQMQELQERISQIQQETEPFKQQVLETTGGNGTMSILTIVLIVLPSLF